MSNGDLDQLQLVAALAEQIYHRNSADDPITLTQLGVNPVSFDKDPNGLVPDTSTDNGTAYYSP